MSRCKSTDVASVKDTYNDLSIKSSSHLFLATRHLPAKHKQRQELAGDKDRQWSEFMGFSCETSTIKRISTRAVLSTRHARGPPPAVRTQSMAAMCRTYWCRVHVQWGSMCQSNMGYSSSSHSTCPMCLQIASVDTGAVNHLFVISLGIYNIIQRLSVLKSLFRSVCVWAPVIILFLVVNHSLVALLPMKDRQNTGEHFWIFIIMVIMFIFGFMLYLFS